MKKVILSALLVVIFLIACDKISKAQFFVDSSACNSCGICISVCPADAIEFDENNKAIIDQTKCTQCGECILVCPQDAIY
ncbi:MAG: 4Fe-4S binding protein [Candidatus Cloacimonetes bacterium]|jgi:uncharacterized protein|nr:4Fe-4S binding protein [Candidatus Cloacimonadota bacterium]MBT6993729.1 4Fe-4S binding protein [Candidatus Cloacimonadota bacterium]MBT7469771.1 4Fe-4S binding protein [Candidatus Cloacimonadota bacterium]